VVAVVVVAVRNLAEGNLAEGNQVDTGQVDTAGDIVVGAGLAHTEAERTEAAHKPAVLGAVEVAGRILGGIAQGVGTVLEAGCTVVVRIAAEHTVVGTGQGGTGLVGIALVGTALEAGRTVVVRKAGDQGGAVARNPEGQDALVP